MRKSYVLQISTSNKHYFSTHKWKKGKRWKYDDYIYIYIYIYIAIVYNHTLFNILGTNV
jgi:hypothetical protein